LNPAQVNISCTDENHLRGTWNNLYTLIWRGAVTKQATDAVADEIDQLRKTQPKGVGLCVIIEESSPVPGADERQWTKDMFNRLGKDLLFVAAIPEGKGIWATAARTALTTFQFIMPSIYQQRIFSEPNEATAWIAERMSNGTGGVKPTDVSQAFDAMRAKFPRKQVQPVKEGSGGLMGLFRKK
jgi:hypothetical protein